MFCCLAGQVTEENADNCFLFFLRLCPFENSLESQTAAIADVESKRRAICVN